MSIAHNLLENVKLEHQSLSPTQACICTEMLKTAELYFSDLKEDEYFRWNNNLTGSLAQAKLETSYISFYERNKSCSFFSICGNRSIPGSRIRVKDGPSRGNVE